jgi:predicted transposase YbfD/YdcC
MDHGRLEVRQTRTCTRLDWLQERHDWPGLKAIATMSAKRDDGPVQTRLFLLSEPIDAQTAAGLIRGHWGIENALHWVLDVTMREDAHRAGKKNTPANLAMPRCAALNIIKANTSKGSDRIIFKRAGWDNKFLKRLINQI